VAEETTPDNKEVDEQLEYLFAEAGSGAADPDADPQPGPLRELKAIFLAVDWEINDDIMSALLRQIDLLTATFKDDRIMTLFLQLLGAVGKYIKINKANAHPDAIKLLNSIYTSLEIVSMSEGMTEKERKKILRTEVNRFQRLKDKLARKAAPAAAAAPKPPSSGEAPSEEVPPALRYVLKELQKTIREEFAALRAQLKS
jgi:pilus assembly protein FimV